MASRITNADLAKKLDQVIEELHEMNGRQRTDHDEITRLKEQVGIAAKAQAGFSVLASAIGATLAAWLGMQR